MFTVGICNCFLPGDGSYETVMTHCIIIIPNVTDGNARGFEFYCNITYISELGSILQKHQTRTTSLRRLV